MCKILNEPDHTHWIIVKKSVDMDIPKKATPFCIVNPTTRDEQYELDLVIRHLGIMGYAMKVFKDSFDSQYKLSKLETLSVQGFIDKYAKDYEEK